MNSSENLNRELVESAKDLEDLVEKYTIENDVIQIKTFEKQNFYVKFSTFGYFEVDKKIKINFF